MIQILALIALSYSNFQHSKIIGQSSQRFHHFKGDSIEINLPFSEHYFKENSLFQASREPGDFIVRVPGSRPKLALLRYKNREKWLILNPGQPTEVQIDTTQNEKFFVLPGTPKTENDLLNSVEPQSGLWFSTGISRQGPKFTGNNIYVNWPRDSLVDILLPRIRNSLDSCIGILARSHVSEAVKETLKIEVKYYYANELHKLIQGWGWVKEFANAITTEIYNPVQWAEIPMFGMPLETELDVSQSARIWMSKYLELKFSQRVDSFDRNPDTGQARAIFAKASGMPWENRQQLMLDMGQTYPMYVIDRQNILPGYGEERRLADIVFLGAENDLLVGVTTFQNNLLKEFPLSQYIPLCRKKIASVETTATSNRSNTGIHILNGTTELNSLAALIQPYRGKVIYLDMWGTWCGPCIREMQFAGTLRERFKGKNVVFLYLDMDDEKNDARWREFIYYHNLAGEHVRMNERQLEIIWKGLDEQSRAYPRYYIFDANGDLAVKDAERPSDGQQLYQQIDNVLTER